MADRSAELRRWIGELSASDKPTERVIAEGARFILGSIEGAPDSPYRGMALCKLTDAVTLAAIASRQPQPESQTAPKSG